MALPANWRELAMVMATSTLVGMTISLAMPLLSLVLERDGYDNFLIGLNAAAGGLGIFVVAPFLPWLLRAGAVRVMQGGILIAAAVMLVLPLKVDLTLWFALRLLLGCGTAAIWVVSEAAVNALAEERLRGRIMGVYGTLFCVGYVAGPAVVALFGSEGMRPFVISAALLLAGFVPASMAHAANAALARAPGAAAAMPMRDVVRRSLLPLGAIICFGVLESAVFALLAIWGLASGYSEAGAALLISVLLLGNIGLQIPIGWLADHVRRDRMLVALALLSMALLALLVPARGFPVLVWLVLVILGGLLGGLYSLSLSLIGERFAHADLTIANTVFIMMLNVGVILGPFGGGAAMQAFGAWVLPLALMVPLAGFVLFAKAIEGRERPVREALPADRA